MVHPLVRYLGKRLLILVATLIIATFITVVIAEMGGYVDKILISLIKTQVEQEIARNPQFQGLPANVKEEIIKERVHAIIHSRGLDQPLPIRIIRYTIDALTFRLGQAMFIRSSSGSSEILDIIMERLPWTVLLFVTGTIISALIGIYLGLKMAQKAHSLFDKAMCIYAIVTQTFPAWFMGILLIIAFSVNLRLLPPGGVPPFMGSPFEYALEVLRHMALPLTAWVLTNFGYWAYITRNIVIGVMSEDYVWAARARGIPEKAVLYKYVLRPASPPIITSVALSLVFSLQGAIITETVFQWPGLGSLYWEAITMLDAPLVIQLTVFYAYLLVATVFILDVIYSILDPRIRTGVV